MKTQGCGWLLILLAAGASAGDKVAETAAAAPAAAASAAENVSYTAYMGQMLLGLTAVLLLILAIAWVLRRFGNGGLMGSQHMKVVASLALGPRERLVVVEVGEQQLLLGLAPGRITTLHTFTTPVIPTDSNRELSEFGQKIREIIGRGAIKPQ